MKELQEKIKERITGLVPELITDEKILETIKESIEKLFFQKTTVKDSFHSREVDSVAEEIIVKILKPIVSQKVDNWMRENYVVIEEKVDKVIKEGIASILLQSINEAFNNSLYNLKQEIMNRFQV